MEAVVDPMVGLTLSQVALLLLAVQYGVLAPGWVGAAVMLPAERRAALWCAGHAAASGLGMALTVLGMHWQLNAPRAVGNVLLMLGMLALQRAIWAFASRRVWPRSQALVLLLTLGMAFLTLSFAPAFVPWRIAMVSLIWGGLYLWCAADTWRYLRTEARRLAALLCVLPMAMAAAILLVRAVRAVWVPDLVLLEVRHDTLPGLGTAMGGLVVVLLLQFALVGLMVGRLNARLGRQSRHDALTGLLNRRAIDQLLHQEEHRVRRLSGSLAVLMVDIDHFKRINDSLGHAAGDQALQHLATLMQGNLRQIDHVARWGGEEFIAMLPGTGGEEAERLAERLRERIRAAPVVVGGQSMALTASIGVAAWGGPADSRESMVARADAALYQAKREGRDRVRRHGASEALAA